MSRPRVLIVDESAETREVLHALLERQGVTTIEARRPEQALPLVNLYRPHLIVLDAESDRSTGGTASEDLRAVAQRSHTAIVILGTLSRSRKRLAVGQFVAKPYHYEPLIRKIDGLLEAGGGALQADLRSTGTR